MTQGFCPLHGDNHPCERCMWSIHDNDNNNVMCSVSRLASVITSNGKYLDHLTMKVS